MKLELKKITLENFKGIKNLEIDFTKDTTIRGGNGTGKTTIFDAYSWLLWDKDSLSRKDFDIKPIDKNGDVIRGVESKVEGLLEVDEKEVRLAKVYREIWSKKRGSTEETFTGNTTDYFINDVPVKKGEYNDRVGEIISEKHFNLLSNPLYFSTILDKKERRQVLLELIDDVDKEDLIRICPKLKELDLDNYSIDEIKAMAKASAKKINDEIKSLPIRIDELLKAKVDYDFDELEKEKAKLEERTKYYEARTNTLQGKFDGLSKDYEKINELEKEKLEIEREVDRRNAEKKNKAMGDLLAKKGEHDKKKLGINSKLTEKNVMLTTLKSTIETLGSRETRLNEELGVKRQEWIDNNAKKFDGSMNCPTCGKEFDEAKKEEIIANFNQNKSKVLNSITTRANEIKLELEKIGKSKLETERDVNTLKEEIQVLETDLKVLGEFKEVEAEVVKEELPPRYFEINTEISEVKNRLESEDTSEQELILEEKKATKLELEDVISKLAMARTNEEIDKKVELYSEQEKDLAKSYEKQQKKLYLCDEYTRAYTSLIEDKVNGMFESVNFKLFDTQVNGALVETCEVTIKGVPFASANNAGRINAGLDVIKTLSKVMDKKVPIFVDNAESVNELKELDSQMVRLVVTVDIHLIIEER